MAKQQNRMDRVIFTKQMKKDYTILAPNMLPLHFKLFSKSFALHGYRLDPLETTDREIVEQGLQNVHNDTCYPALLVIGQLIHALKSGNYDIHKTAVMMTQTGGGCRASNYIHLLRKALKKAGFSSIPVVSLNLSGMEKNPGFNLSFGLVKKLGYSILYGDLLMHLAHQTKPYEIHLGDTNRMIQQWIDRLSQEFEHKKYVSYARVKRNVPEMIKTFHSIPRREGTKTKVGIVGEIYMKFAPLGNNNLEDFLERENVEVVVPGLLDFVIFNADSRLQDRLLYGGGGITRLVAAKFKRILINWQNDIILSIRKYSTFRAPTPFEHIKQLAGSYVGHGNKMGEGWLLTGEMLELIDAGIHNIICTQPFGCLPNHIVGKGMIRKIKQHHPQANIVSIDYDPGASVINQENRIKLMISNAKRQEHTLMDKKTWQPKSASPKRIPVASEEVLTGYPIEQPDQQSV